MDPFDRFLDGHLPRPSYCGAAAAMSICVASLAAACAGAFVATTYLIDRLWRPRETARHR